MVKLERRITMSGQLYPCPDCNSMCAYLDKNCTGCKSPLHWYNEKTDTGVKVWVIPRLQATMQEAKAKQTTSSNTKATTDKKKQFPCPDCGNLCAYLSKNCPKCGSPLNWYVETVKSGRPTAREKVPDNIRYTDAVLLEQPKLSSTQRIFHGIGGATAGVVLGLIILIVYLVIGVATGGIGLACCFPLLIFAFYLPFELAKEVASDAPSILQGKCPYCEMLLNVGEGSLGVDCPICKKRIVVKNMRFYRVE
jgi:predicted RNA-binding Zn-ribbon protein involved in translation (DUF1610 family)